MASNVDVRHSVNWLGMIPVGGGRRQSRSMRNAESASGTAHSGSARRQRNPMAAASISATTSSTGKLPQRENGVEPVRG